LGSNPASALRCHERASNGPINSAETVPLLFNCSRAWRTWAGDEGGVRA
jgi:hypothetical protein